MDIKKQLVEKLAKDCEIILNQKLKSALDNSNEGTYRNLVRALEDNLKLIERYSTRDMVIRNLRDIKLLNDNNNVVHTIGFATNIEIHHTTNSYGEFRGRCCKNVIPVELLNKSYKLIANGMLENIFNNNTYDIELEIGNIKILQQTRNDELVFRMIKVDENPLYIIKVMMK